MYHRIQTTLPCTVIKHIKTYQDISRHGTQPFWPNHGQAIGASLRGWRQQRWDLQDSARAVRHGSSKRSTCTHKMLPTGEDRKTPDITLLSLFTGLLLSFWFTIQENVKHHQRFPFKQCWQCPMHPKIYFSHSTFFSSVMILAHLQTSLDEIRQIQSNPRYTSDSAVSILSAIPVSSFLDLSSPLPRSSLATNETLCVRKASPRKVLFKFKPCWSKSHKERRIVGELHTGVQSH